MLGQAYRVAPNAALRAAMEMGLWSPDDLPILAEYISGAEFLDAGALALHVTQGEFWTGTMEVHWTILCAPTQPD